MSDTLHYPRNITSGFNLDQVIGPDRFRAYYTFTGVEYDPAAGHTVASLRPLPPAEVDERIRAKMAKYAAQSAAIEFYRGFAA